MIIFGDYELEGDYIFGDYGIENGLILFMIIKYEICKKCIVGWLD